MTDSNNTRRPADEVLSEIHERVNMDLVALLTDAIKSYVEKNGEIKTNVVAATFAYMLADAMSQNCTHDYICNMAETYGEYIHRAAHGMLTIDGENDDIGVVVLTKPSH